MIQAVWSPQVCVVEQRVNRNRLDDSRKSIYERAVTFDGPAQLSDIVEPITRTTQSRVQGACDSIVSHIERMKKGVRVAGLVCHFKIDAQDRLNLLWCSSLRVVKAVASTSRAHPLLSHSCVAHPFFLD